MSLLACPFCREMFEEGEAKTCPVCAMKLERFDALPPSIEADDDGVPLAPELAIRPWTSLDRGRGALAALGLVGMVLFFLPWIRLTMPDIVAKSGFDLAHERIGWLWGTFAAWSVLVPTVLSRRSIAQMRGARVAAAFLGAVPLVATTILLLKPPKGGLITIRFTFAWPIWATVGLSLVAIAFAVRFGGRADDIVVTRGTGAGQNLH